MIEVDSISRVFTPKRRELVTALSGVSFEIGRGELFGVLGPNGAGKTTLVKILSTLLVPTTGHASIDGLDVVENAKQLRRRIGVVFGGERGLYDRLSAYDNLKFSAELYGIPWREQAARIDGLLDQVGLADKRAVLVETFSRGMRQRLHIARALLHDPDVIFLDEPSNGLDPVAARELRDLIRTLTAAGKTILLTTHYMFEADELCSRLAVIAGGSLVEVGTPAEIKSAAAVGSRFVFDAYEPYAAELEAIRSTAGVIEVSDRELDGYVQWTVRTHPDSVLSREVLASRLGVSADLVVSQPTSLEDAYVALINRGA